MIQVALDAKGLHVLSAQRCSFPQDRSLSTIITAIRRLLDLGNFHGRRVVASLPNDGLRTSSIHLSNEDLAQDVESLTVWLADRYGFNLEQETIRHIVVGQQSSAEQIRNEVILLAADNTEIDERIHLLLDSGLVPVGLDPVGSALYRCYDRILQRHEDYASSILYIDIGARYTTVALGREHQLCFIKQLSLGNDHIRERIAKSLGVDIHESDTLRERVQRWILSCEAAGKGGIGKLYEPEDGQSVGLDRATQHMIRDAVDGSLQEIAHEIGLCLRYYSVTFRGHPVHRAILSGGMGQDRMLIQSLGQHLGIDLVSLNPFEFLRMEVGEKQEQDSKLSCQWAVSLGLALKKLEFPHCTSVKSKASRLQPATCLDGGQRDG
jgi:type IV pilus assembly protein PilM